MTTNQTPNPLKAGESASELEALAAKIEGNHIISGGNGPNFSMGWSMANEVSARMVREFAATPSPADRAASVGAVSLTDQQCAAQLGLMKTPPMKDGAALHDWAMDVMRAGYALAPQSPPTGVSGSQAVAEIRAGNLAWHIPSLDYKVPQRFLVGLHKLYAAPQEAVERQPLTGWISVDERLPEENVPVLVTKDGGHEYIDLDVMEEGVWRDWCEYVEHVEVIGGCTSDVKLYTHWAPIPRGIGPATQEKQHG